VYLQLYYIQHAGADPGKDGGGAKGASAPPFTVGVYLQYVEDYNER